MLAPASDVPLQMLLAFLLPEIQSYWGISSATEALIASVTFAGMAIGAYSWGLLGDLIGRKKSIALSCLWTASFGLLSAFSPSIEWLIVSRAITGVGLGGVAVAFTLFAEFLPTKRRGVLLVAISFMWTVGKYKCKHSATAVAVLLTDTRDFGRGGPGLGCPD